MDEINALRQMLEELENGSELAEGKLTVAEYELRHSSLIMSIKLMENQMEVKTDGKQIE